MSPKAQAELDRLTEQDDRDERICARAVERATIAYREEISRMTAEMSTLKMNVSYLRKLAANVCGLAPQDMDAATLDAIAEMARHIEYPGY